MPPAAFCASPSLSYSTARRWIDNERVDVLADGSADFVAMGRKLLADPDQVGLTLTEYEASGDWRLFLVHHLCIWRLVCSRTLCCAVLHCAALCWHTL